MVINYKNLEIKNKLTSYAENHIMKFDKIDFSCQYEDRDIQEFSGKIKKYSDGKLISRIKNSKGKNRSLLLGLQENEDKIAFWELGYCRNLCNFYSFDKIDDDIFEGKWKSFNLISRLGEIIDEDKDIKQKIIEARNMPITLIKEYCDGFFKREIERDGKYAQLNLG